MTGRMRSWARDTEELAPVIQEAEPGLFEHRAMLVFRALAAIFLFGIVLAFFHAPGTLSLLLIIGYNAAAFVLALAYLVIARGLRVVQPWAVSIARPVLVLVIVQDVLAFASGIVDGHIRGLPVNAVLAGWALLGPAGVRPVPWPKLLSVLAFALVAPMLVLLAFARPIFDWGGALDVQPSDIVPTLTASCGPPGDNPGTPAGQPPAQIHLAFDWAWKKSTPVPSGLDVVVVGWSGLDAAGRPLYFLGPPIPTQAGIYSGRREYPSLEMGNAVAAESRGSWQWGVALDEHGIAPGRIEVDLVRARDAAPGAEPLRIQVSYVHLGQWHADVPLTCEW